MKYENDFVEGRDSKSQVPSLREQFDLRREGYYDPGFENGKRENNINILKYYLYLFYNDRYLIITAVVGCVLLGVITALLSTKKYQAVATVQINQQSLNIVNNTDVLQSQNEQDFVRTQLEVLKSRKLAEIASSRVNLVKDTTIQSKSIIRKIKSAWRNSSAGISKDIAVKFILDRSHFILIRGTRVVKISFIDTNPSRAQLLANALAESYLQLNLDLKVAANSYAKSYLSDQLGVLKVKLETSERKLVEYAEKNRIVNLESRATMPAELLSAANTSLSKAIDERIKAEFLWNQAKKSVGFGLPQILDNKFIEKIRTNIVELKSKYHELRGLYTEKYPTLRRLRTQIGELEKLLQREVVTIKQVLKASFQAAKYREDLATLQVEHMKSQLLAHAKRSVPFNILKRENRTTRALYDSLLNRYKEIGVAGGIGANNVSIVDKAQRPVIPYSPNILLNFVLSFFLGLFGGVGISTLRRHLDDKIKGPEDVERVTGLATLGVIPKTDELLMEFAQQKDNGDLAEAYRSLVSSLQFSTPHGTPKILLVTSSGAGEGKSTTSVNLAKYFSRLGQSVLLVDCDLRKSHLHQTLDLSNEIGLSSVLAGRCKFPEAVQVVKAENLMMVVCAGPFPPNPVELLSHPRLISLLGIASEKFDQIILDGPPVMGLADAPILSSVSNGTLFTVAANQTQSAHVLGALRRLRAARGALVGSVTTKFESSQADYGYGDIYSYSYDYRNGDEDVKRVKQLD